MSSAKRQKRMRLADARRLEEKDLSLWFTGAVCAGPFPVSSDRFRQTGRIGRTDGLRSKLGIGAGLKRLPSGRMLALWTCKVG